MTSLPTILTRTGELRSGRTDAEMRAAIAAGRLIRLRSGTYFDAAKFAALSSSRQYLVRVQAEAAASPDLIVSHLSAAVLHGLPLVDDPLTQVHLTRPGHGGARTMQARRVHTGILGHDEITVAGGIQVTSVERTVVDLARSTNLRGAVAVGDAALQLKLALPDVIADLYRQSARSRGHGRAARVLRLIDGRAESAGETCFRLAVAGRVPELELQVAVYDDDGKFCGRSDGALPEFGILEEFDGHVKYAELLKPGESLIVGSQLRGHFKLTPPLRIPI